MLRPRAPSKSVVLLVVCGAFPFCVPSSSSLEGLLRSRQRSRAEIKPPLRYHDRPMDLTSGFTITVSAICGSCLAKWGGLCGRPAAQGPPGCVGAMRRVVGWGFKSAGFSSGRPRLFLRTCRRLVCNGRCGNCGPSGEAGSNQIYQAVGVAVCSQGNDAAAGQRA